MKISEDKLRELGVNNDEDVVLGLKKNIYGLKQAGHL